MNESSHHEPIRLEGLAAVKGALLGGYRPIEEIVVDRKRDDRATSWLLRKATGLGVRSRRVDRATLDELAPESAHGGIIAHVGVRRTLALEELPLPRDRAPLVMMLDGVEDPFNLGFAIRALWAAGVDALVLRRRSWGSAESVIARSSAGASELIPTALVDRPEEAADALSARGLTVAVTAKEEESVSLYDADLTTPLFLLIGGERRGVTRAFLDRADLLIGIPYGRDFRQSLGAASAAGIIAFEAMRQREGREGERERGRKGRM